MDTVKLAEIHDPQSIEELKHFSDITFKETCCTKRYITITCNKGDEYPACLKFLSRPIKSQYEPDSFKRDCKNNFIDVYVPMIGYVFITKNKS